MSLITATTPQESVRGRVRAIRDKNESQSMYRLLVALQTDLATLQANYNLLLAQLDAASAAATTLAGGTVTGTVFAGYIPATQVATFGADVPATAANLLATTLFQP